VRAHRCCGIAYVLPSCLCSSAPPTSLGNCVAIGCSQRYTVSHIFSVLGAHKNETIDASTSKQFQSGHIYGRIASEPLHQHLLPHLAFKHDQYGTTCLKPERIIVAQRKIDLQHTRARSNHGSDVCVQKRSKRHYLPLQASRITQKDVVGCV
jgi:hypothetical protein